MANATHLQLFGNEIAVLFDDGTKKLAYPTGSDLWIISGATGPGPDPDPEPTGDWVQQYPTATVSSHYGPRSGGTGSFHEGTDWGAFNNGGAGTPIRSVGTGTVSESYLHGNFGNMVIVDHGTVTVGSHAGKQIKSLYAHLIAPGVPVGTEVVATTSELGGMGNTGASDGAHLHLEIHVMNPGSGIVWNTQNNGGFRTAVNPIDFFAEYMNL